MMPDELAERFKKLKATLPDVIGGMISRNAHVVEDLQTAQLETGTDNEGNAIEPAYSPVTIAIKQAKGQPFDRVTLKDTGDFHAGLFLSGGANNQFAIGSSDVKTKKLQNKYGEDILGLNDDSKQQLIDDLIRPEIGREGLKVLNT